MNHNDEYYILLDFDAYVKESKKIEEHYGHIDFIIESNNGERFKRWTIVYTSTVDIGFLCPKSCYIFYQ